MLKACNQLIMASSGCVSCADFDPNQVVSKQEAFDVFIVIKCCHCYPIMCDWVNEWVSRVSDIVVELEFGNRLGERERERKGERETERDR